MKKSEKALAVFFPGTGYTCAHPLLYRCRARYAALGYECLPLSFDGIDFGPMETAGEAISAAEGAALRQICEIDFAACRDVVFVSKSLGTAVAHRLDEALSIHARHLYLTPIPEALPGIVDSLQTIAAVLGSHDPFLAAETLAAHCRARGVPCHIIEGVAHRLEDADDPARTRAILDGVEALCAGNATPFLFQ